MRAAALGLQQCWSAGLPSEWGLAFANFFNTGFHTVRFPMRPGLSQVLKAPPAGVPYASRKRTRRSSAPRAFSGVQGAGSDRHHALLQMPGCRLPARCSRTCSRRGAPCLGPCSTRNDSGRLLRGCVPSFRLTCYARGLMLRSSAWGCAQTQPCRALSALWVSMCTRVRERGLAYCRQCVGGVERTCACS